MSTSRRIRGENRFYNPPPMRKLQQEREKKRLEAEEMEKAKREAKEMLDRKIEESDKEMKRPEECSTSDCSVPGRVSTTTTGSSSNLGRFLECTTPLVSTQHLPLTSIKGWRTREPEYRPYFLLNDLWDSFEEWSAYGVGVPLLLNGIDSVVQYYVPYLSGIQLYEDPSRACTSRRRRAGEESDGDSPRDMSSDGSNDCRDLSQSLYRVSLEEKPCTGSSSDESEVSNSPGDLVFEYLEAAMPFGREPLTDKISNLSSQFPALRTYRSCDLSPSSWVSVAWYPIYRIPLGQTLQNLDACFLTFHSLSTPCRGTSNEEGQSSSKSVAPSNFTLPTFGLAYYKFKLSEWSPKSDVEENQRVVTLLQAAEEWLRRLKVILPDFRHFVSHSGSTWR